MKRAATHLFKRQNKNRAFQNYRTFTFTPPPPPPRARQRSENPAPGASKMCESPGVAPGGGGGQAWN